MKVKDFKYCIIVDNEDRPMSWSPRDKQLCYCNNETWKDDVHPVMVVSVKTARKQIEKTISNRKSWGFSSRKYLIMPVEANHE